MEQTAAAALKGSGKFTATAQTPEADRTVSADQIQARLAVDGASVELTRCIVRGAIDICERSVGHVTLRQCSIDGLDARDADLRGSLELDGSTIAGTLQLLGTIVGGVLSFRSLHVQGDLNVVNCRVRSGFPAPDLVVDGECIAYDLTVDASADFTRAHFGAGANFTNARIGRTLKLDGAVFHGVATFDDATAVVVGAHGTAFSADASFAGMNVTSKMSFVNAAFAGNAVFGAAQVGNQMVLAECRIAKNLDLSNVKARTMTLSDRVEGTTLLDGLAVAAVFDASRSAFEGSFTGNGVSVCVLQLGHSRFGGDFELTDLQVDAGADLTFARFTGSFRLAGSKLGGDFQCAGTAFGGVTVLETVAVAGSAHFTAHPPGDDTHGHGAFGDRVGFSGVTIGYDLRLENMDAHGAPVALKNTRVGGNLAFADLRAGDVDLSGATVAGNVEMLRLRCDTCKLANVTVTGDLTIADRSELGTVDLYGTSIGGTLSICDSHIRDVLHAKFVTVARDADFRGSTIPAIDVRGGTVTGSTSFRELCDPFPKRVGLSGATFGAIELMDDVSVADARARRRFADTAFDLADCTYGSVACDPKLLMERFADPVNRQPYLQLEATLRKCGFDTAADDVYASGRRNSKSPPGTSGWIRDVVAESVAGYGVSFRRIGSIIAATFVLGWLYFAAVPGATRLTTPLPAPSAALSTTPPSPALPAAVRTSPPVTLADAAPAADPACTKPVPAGLLPGGWIAFQAVVPAAFPNSGWAVADDCPIFGWPNWTFAFTMFVVLVLKLVEWTLLPVLLLMVTGIIRPRASA